MKIFFTSQLFLLFFIQIVQAQDIYIFGGYSNSNIKEFKDGLGGGLGFEYNFTPKFSQDLSLVYFKSSYDEEYFDGIGNFYKYKRNTYVFSLRTHSLFSLFQGYQNKLSIGPGISFIFFNSSSPNVVDYNKFGIALLLKYSEEKIFNTSLGMFCAIRSEFLPSLGKLMDAYSPYTQKMLAFEINAGVKYTFERRKQI